MDQIKSVNKVRYASVNLNFECSMKIIYNTKVKTGFVGVRLFWKGLSKKS